MGSAEHVVIGWISSSATQTTCLETTDTADFSNIRVAPYKRGLHGWLPCSFTGFTHSGKDPVPGYAILDTPSKDTKTRTAGLSFSFTSFFHCSSNYHTIARPQHWPRIVFSSPVRPFSQRNSHALLQMERHIQEGHLHILSRYLRRISSFLYVCCFELLRSRYVYFR